MIDFKKYGVVEVAEMAGDDAEDTKLLEEMLSRATAYMSRFKWCKKIVSSYFGMGVGGIFAIFLFEVEDSAASENQLYWVITGDIPPAYLSLEEEIENPAEALVAYIEWMEAWVDAARNGESVDELMPVNVEPTPENAGRLETRLRYLKENFLAD